MTQTPSLANLPYTNDPPRDPLHGPVIYWLMIFSNIRNKGKCGIGYHESGWFNSHSENILGIIKTLVHI